MPHSYQFLMSVINAVPQHIVVIDSGGAIQFVNQAWITFSGDNECLVKGNEWQGINYLRVCEESGNAGDEFGANAARGIRQVLNRELDLFTLEYPCHSPDEKRWFLMRVAPFQTQGKFYCAISHDDITERRLAEEKVLSLSRIDGLTGVPNRRYFDEFLHSEWRRCRRLCLPITVGIMDIDHFKLLNDQYGHQAGDECLIKVGEILTQLEKRPGDFFARYGGEEFSFVFGNTTSEQALVPVKRITTAICALNIPNAASPIRPTVTVSVGLATTYPDAHKIEQDLIGAADKMLYSAKEKGKNQVVF